MRRAYGVQVEAIMRTDDTWMCWAFEAIEEVPPLAAVVPLAVVPAPLGAPAPVDPAPLAVDPAPVVPLLELIELLFEPSVPVISTWCPLCCARSDSRPSRM
jgi:hypothetical protein